MVLEVNINKTELLILPVSTQLGSTSLSHSGLFYSLLRLSTACFFFFLSTFLIWKKKM